VVPRCGAGEWLQQEASTNAGATTRLVEEEFKKLEKSGSPGTPLPRHEQEEEPDPVRTAEVLSITRGKAPHIFPCEVTGIDRNGETHCPHHGGDFVDVVLSRGSIRDARAMVGIEPSGRIPEFSRIPARGVSSTGSGLSGS
jgi:hypothetical protein